MWCLCTSAGELLCCQPYAGIRTQIPDQGLGQGPNVVLGLAQEYGLSPGTKLSADNLFVNFDLCDHMAERGWGGVGTLRQNRVVGVPLPNKKDAAKGMARGDMDTAWSDNICACVWKDSQPVYVASNFSTPEPVGACRRFAGHGKGFVSVPCPKIVQDYNSSMGGVDQLNQNVKSYSITPRQKKWYWGMYTWFLNVQMVQAWRLYRHTYKERHLQIRETEKCEDQELEASAMSNVEKTNIKKEREEGRRVKRKEEKKKEEVGLLAFTRDSVELLVLRHGEARHMPAKAARASVGSREAIRFDHSTIHCVIRTEIKGVCNHCMNELNQQKRSFYRCKTCNVALHPDCFEAYHKA